jgi:hypothetical protein
VIIQEQEEKGSKGKKIKPGMLLRLEEVISSFMIKLLP